MSKSLVSIVAPVFNEVESLEPLVERINCAMAEVVGQYDWELLLVDDGSTDGSGELLGKLARQYDFLEPITLTRNFGQTAALQAGIDSARGQVIVTLDADLQHPPEEIPRLINSLEDGVDMVCTWREHREEGLVRRLPSKAANLILRVITGLDLHDFGSTLRVCRANILKEVKLYGEFHRFIPALVHHAGGVVREISVPGPLREFGKSKYGLERTFGVLLDLFVLLFFVRYLDRPIRAFGKLGTIFCSIGLVILAVMVAMATLYKIPMFREHPGWFIGGVMFILVGFQIFLVGI